MITIDVKKLRLQRSGKHPLGSFEKLFAGRNFSSGNYFSAIEYGGNVGGLL